MSVILLKRLQGLEFVPIQLKKGGGTIHNMHKT
jgi:hypothetical protein